MAAAPGFVPASGGGRRTACALAIAAVALTAAPSSVVAQAVSFRVASVDMQGSAVFAANSEVGAGFGARLAVAELFGHRLRAGLRFDWWTADRSDSEIELRDVIVGLSFWKSLGSAATIVRPYLGLATAVHSLDASLMGGAPFPGERPLEADRLEGVRVGASAFTGLSLRLTRTGAIRALAEYRFTALSRPSHHEVRIGARLLLAAL